MCSEPHDFRHRLNSRSKDPEPFHLSLGRFRALASGFRVQFHCVFGLGGFHLNPKPSTLNYGFQDFRGNRVSLNPIHTRRLYTSSSKRVPNPNYNPTLVQPLSPRPPQEPWERNSMKSPANPLLQALSARVKPQFLNHVGWNPKSSDPKPLKTSTLNPEP